jgi:hypothetical protein
MPQPSSFQTHLGRILFWAVRHYLWDKFTLLLWAVGGGVIGLSLALLEHMHPREMEGVLVALPVLAWLAFVLVTITGINREDWYGHAPGRPASPAFVLAALRFVGADLEEILRGELAKRIKRKRGPLGRYDVTDVVENVLHRYGPATRARKAAADAATLAQYAAICPEGDRA